MIGTWALGAPQHWDSVLGGLGGKRHHDGCVTTDPSP